MERDKVFFRHVLLHYFDLNKSVSGAHQLLEECYGDQDSSHTTCKEWYRLFKSKDFDVNDKPRSGKPKKFEDDESQALLHENSARTLVELGNKLGVTAAAVSKRLHALGKIQKEGKWVSNELSDSAIHNRFNIAVPLLARQKKKSFLWHIVTGDEKWIYYDNPKRKKSWVNPGQPSTLQPKRNIHGHKIMLCIWWDQQGVVYYELLKPNETITVDA